MISVQKKFGGEWGPIASRSACPYTKVIYISLKFMANMIIPHESE